MGLPGQDVSRQERHAASRMEPDSSRWRSTYELARNGCAEYVPALREWIENGLAWRDTAPAAAARRKVAEEEFRKHYER